jgi:TonB family protein
MNASERAVRKLLLAFAALLISTPLLSADASEVKIPSRKKALATYAPKPQVPAEARLKHLSGAGIFVFHVRPDGTVLRVETLRSTGHAILDKACVEAFSRWRFAAGSVKDIKIPITFTGNYTKP